ncbi:MAG: secondary thiamine-phosphate synthase enzyme YjbQ [Bryobacteraceae bacterium]|jgi:secondary thiamine-phosphate synthase enzyme
MSALPIDSARHSAPTAAPTVHAAPGFRVQSRIVDFITAERTQLMNITERVNEIVRRSGISDGLVHLQSLHTTTGLAIGEWQDALLDDFKGFVESFVARDGDYKHNDPAFSDCERQNADSHLKGSIFGQTLLLQVRNTALLLGTWQSLILAEFDGPRSRSVAVQVSGI